MTKICYLFFSIFALINLVSCSAIELKPGAGRILVTKNSVSEGCKYLGTVVGSQGNFFTGKWTSNSKLAEGSMNDMKNKALDLGANYVQIENHRAGSTFSGGSGSGNGGMSGSQTDVTITGNAYYCKEYDDR